MINLTLRDSNEVSFFKNNLLELCSQPGDTLILSYGYFDEKFSNENLPNLLSNLLSELLINLNNSGTTKIYIIGGQLSIQDFSTLSDDEKIASLAREENRISNILSALTNKLNMDPLKAPNLEIKYLYKARFHSKLAIKFDSNLTNPISILMGSSNLTTPSIIEGVYLDYHTIESDIFLTDIDPNNIIFNNNLDLNFYDFLNSISPEIARDLIPFNFN